jgi:peptide-methionine (S)-S-oxide reductase
MFFTKKPVEIPNATTALPGRDTAIETAKTHYVLGNPIAGEIPDGFEQAMFGMGCFWGVERIFWNITGVWTTAVGYAAGHTPNATYEEVCSGKTGHNEVVWVVFDPNIVSYETLLKTFWEGHNPTQGMRQGNDQGTQYRSGIYFYNVDQRMAAFASKNLYQQRLDASGMSQITTEILNADTLYYAEEYHQQYLAKNPDGYCGIGGTGVTCPIGVGA